jgi:hypothetical protein
MCKKIVDYTVLFGYQLLVDKDFNQIFSIKLVHFIYQYGVFVINQLLIRPASSQPTVDIRVSVIDI